MNPYLKNLEKIEFVVTNACTGRCRHCSEGDHATDGVCIDAHAAVDAICKIAAEYNIKTVMAFGGEPLLYPNVACEIMTAAKELNILRRQVITNGFFAKDRLHIRGVAERLSACGVNDILLSVDAFHQETIPLDVVKIFASEVVVCGIPIRLSPAWLVSREDDNPYNRKTREILSSFADMGIPVGDGNIVFPEGNAKKYLFEYFRNARPENPYVEDPRDVRCISFSPNGDVFGGNICRQDIMKIIRDYAP